MIYLKNFDSPEFNIGEIMRYARIRSGGDSYRSLIDSCIKEAESVLSYRVCYTFLDTSREKGVLYLGSIRSDSATLEKAIKSAGRVLLFAATVGAPFDRLVARYARTEPSKALMMQAIGAERAESLCDAFCGYIDTQLAVGGKRLTARVSPGYGDIGLVMQKDIFAVLDCPRKIGLTLDDSLMMSPSKSVTAICGIVDECYNKHNDKCSECSNTDCAYRAQRDI